MSSAFSSSEIASLEKSVELDEKHLALDEIWCPERLMQCTEWINENQFKKVCLQFPDNLLGFSSQILDEIQNSTVDVGCYILGDTSYGSCCVDETAAAHINADSIVHFGHACLSKPARLPVFYVFPNFKIDTDELVQEMRKQFPDKRTTIAVFYNVGHFYQIGLIKEALNEYTSTVYGSLAIDGDSDVLCWRKNNFNIEHYIGVYIGADDKTFFNLSLSLSVSKWYLYDGNDTRKLVATTSKTSMWMRRRTYYIEKCKDAQCIGIVVGTLSASGYLDVVKHIQNLARNRGTRTYIISVGKVNPAKLANFLEIDCFVLVGCPENDIFTSRDFYKPLLSVFEVEIALNPAWNGELPTNYSVDFRDILVDGKLYRNFNDLPMLDNDVSLITGRVRNVNRSNETTDGNSSENDGIVQERKNHEIIMSSASDSFQNRGWTGLDPALGKDEPAIIEKGRSGIAIKYTDGNDGNSSV